MGILEGIFYMMWRGIAIGVIISAPMGPVGILCVQRTLEKGRSTGFFTGVGAAISDLFYCLLTGFGLSFIEEFLKANQNVIQIIGSIVLVVFGIYLFRSNPARTLKKPEEQRTSRGKNVLSGFLFTFSNPLIIFLIIGLFARFNFLLPEISLAQYLVGYVFIIGGALLWWWMVSWFVDKVRNHFNLRSMWLINKITGGIIMIFALVGIITAFTGMASASRPATEYYNSVRGFGPMGSGGAPLEISAPTCDTVIEFLPLDKAEEFSFSFRCSNLNNRDGRRYRYTVPGGKTCGVRNPAWGIAVKGEGGELKIRFRTEGVGDELRLPYVEATFSGTFSGKRILGDGLDLYIGENSYLLDWNGSCLTLMCGNREYLPVFDSVETGVRADSVGFFVEPGGKIAIDDIVIDIKGRRSLPGEGDYFHYADPDVRESRFARSSDPIEGEWEIYDRSLDDGSLLSGGNYRLALVKNERGYAIVYLSGAVKEAGRWRAGMLKGRLEKTSYQGVFDMEWIDPSGIPLKGEIKAQYSRPDVMTVQFPDHMGSTLRLRKVNRYTKKHAYGMEQTDM